MPATLADIQAKYGDMVYPLYKDEMHEPYMENDNGNGYKGVVLLDEADDKIQCAECGLWYKELQSHLHFTHGMGHKEYKDKYGLFIKTPLCSKSVSARRSKHVQTRNLDWEKIRYKKGITSEKRKESYRPLVAQHQNNYGLCDAQIAVRLVVVRDMAGKKDMSEITSTDLKKYDNTLLRHICHRYGNWELGSKALGLAYIGNKPYEPARLIARLRNFVMVHKYIPYSSRLSELGLGAFSTYQECFGSWRRAKMMAGLDQLLAEIEG